jgi:hypothetical protein
MKTFREANGQAIEWSGKWEYELCSGEDVIGKIHVKAKSGTHAVAESEDGRRKGEVGYSRCGRIRRWTLDFREEMAAL